MKKIAIIAFLLTVCVAAGRAQESRQDISLSGTGLIEPHVSSSKDVYVGADRAFGALASYRFMLTPSNAIEANYGITYQNKIHFRSNSVYDTTVLTRTQEISGAYVHTFNFRKFNPFVEGGGAGIIFLPIRNSGTNGEFALEVRQQTEVGALYGAGIAYEISPSFDIRVEYRGLVSKVPTFGDANLVTNKWYNINNPVVGVAYHF
jgi:opacity protein-like surface antigen